MVSRSIASAILTILRKSTWTALERLLPAMLPHIDLPRALLRGRFMKAAARIEWNGVPIDTTTLALLRQYWSDIQDDLIAALMRTTACLTAAASAWNGGNAGLWPMAFRGRGWKAVASI